MSAVSNPTQFAPADYDRLRPFTVAEYRKMIEAGVLGESEPAELIEGVILRKFRPMTPRECYPQHAFGERKLSLVGSGWTIWLGTAITLDDSEPEPDVAVLKGDVRTYRTRFAGPSEVGLVVEFADASLTFDREVKGRVYARAGIPEYWIVNVVDGQVEVFTQPDPLAAPPRYTHTQVLVKGQAVPLTLGGQLLSNIPVDDLLP